MNDLLFLVPIVAGLGVLGIVCLFQVPKGVAMNRPLFALSVVITSLFWWLSSAILLVYEGKFYFIFNVVVVTFFFVGLAFFFPLPRGATRLNEHGLPGNILIWTGMILGTAHALALMFTATWSADLLAFYAKLGLHGTP